MAADGYISQMSFWMPVKWVLIVGLNFEQDLYHGNSNGVPILNGTTVTCN